MPDKNFKHEKIFIFQVDAHNIVPCWTASSKLEYAARTIRNRINSQLPEFLTQFPPLIKHPHSTEQKLEKINWETALDEVKIDRTVEEIDWAVPGYKGGIEQLESFIKERLKNYGSLRNNPLMDALSNLSPWFHFGMIAPQRAILEVQKYKNQYKASVESFTEEAIVRRELSDNFCYYNVNYDSMKGANQWAIDSLNQHKYFTF